jgi:formate hydrogenlyase subunit 5
MTAQPTRTIGDTMLSMPAWRRLAIDRTAGGDRFVGMHATAIGPKARLSLLLANSDGLDVIDTELAGGVERYPALTIEVPAAAWYEREIADTFGLVADGHPRLEPLVLPLGGGDAVRPRPGSGGIVVRTTPDEAALPMRVLGHGMFTIPHGPVRSGVVESVEYLVETPGEDIAHIGIRVFAKHRGIERRFEDLAARDGVLLAERVEGIASVAHALAYCHAIESIAGTSISQRAAMIRLVHAELERIANHLDVAMKLCDSAGLAVATARFGLHKESVLRLVGSMCGSRFGRGVVVPGGVSALPALAAAELRRRLADLEAAIRADAAPLMRTPSFLDRLRGTGPLDREHARIHGALGPIGRASGFDDDDRRYRPYDGYLYLDVPTVDAKADGDAMSRLAVRWQEISASFTLLRRAIDSIDELAEGELHAPLQAGSGRGIGWAEAPQGEVVYVVDIEDERIRRCKPRSASFHNLVLFHDVFAGDILTDFPFIEASFGLSIAGVAG